MRVNWGRIRRRLAALEDAMRDRVRWRLYHAEMADGRVLLHAALRREGIDPETDETLRGFSYRYRCAPANSARREADLAFAAADPVLCRRENFIVQAREHAARLPRDHAPPFRGSIFDWVAWAIHRLAQYDPLPAPS